MLVDTIITWTLSFLIWWVVMVAPVIQIAKSMTYRKYRRSGLYLPSIPSKVQNRFDDLMGVWFIGLWIGLLVLVICGHLLSDTWRG